MLNAVRIKTDLRELYRWAGRVGLPYDLDYLLHAALRTAFGADAPQPFYFDPTDCCITGYMKNTIRENCLSSVFRSPEYSIVEVRTGAWYGFRLRCRPTVRWNENGKTVESDIWLRKMYLDWLYGDRSLPPGEYRRLHADTRFPGYISWLQERLESAAEISAHVTSFAERALTARGDKGHTGRAKRVSESRNYTDISISGVLTVRDCQEFERVVLHGIGRYKMFGFGMIRLNIPTI